MNIHANNPEEKFDFSNERRKTRDFTSIIEALIYGWPSIRLRQTRFRSSSRKKKRVEFIVCFLRENLQGTICGCRFRSILSGRCASR